MEEKKIYIPAGVLASFYNILDEDNETKMLPYHDLFYFMVLFEKHFLKTKSGKEQGFVSKFYTMPHWPDVEGNDDNYSDYYNHQAWLRKYASRYSDSFEEVMQRGQVSDLYAIYLKMSSQEMKSCRGQGVEKNSRFTSVFFRINELIKDYGDYFYKSQKENMPTITPDALDRYTRSNIYVFSRVEGETKDEQLEEAVEYFRAYMGSERCKILHNRAERNFSFSYSDEDLVSAFKAAMVEFKENGFVKHSQSFAEQVKGIVGTEPFFTSD